MDRDVKHDFLTWDSYRKLRSEPSTADELTAQLSGHMKHGTVREFVRDLEEYIEFLRFQEVRQFLQARPREPTPAWQALGQLQTLIQKLLKGRT